MSGITLATAQSQLDALLEAQSNNMLTVTIGNRSVSYRSAADIQQQINYWARIVNDLTRQAGGESRHGFKVANFNRNA
jgi:hypothetical protein